MSHEQENGAGAVLAPLLDYDADGYTGQLALDSASVCTAPADKKSYSYTVSDSRDFTNLPRNDTYSIPKTATKNGVSLKLADVAWTATGDGLYSATALYTGTGYGSKVTGYTTTASYTGTVARSTLKSVTWKVIYEGTPLLAPEPEPDLAAFFLNAWAITIVLLAASIFLTVYVWRLYSRSLKRFYE